MISRIVLFLIIMISLGCDPPPVFEVMPIKIIAVVKEDTKWGCIGTDYYSIVEIIKTKERRKVCGHFGEVGEEAALRLAVSTTRGVQW